MHSSLPSLTNHAKRQPRSVFSRLVTVRRLSIALVILLLLILLRLKGNGTSNHEPSIVIISTWDGDFSSIMKAQMEQNRQEYADLHGYKLVSKELSGTDPVAKSWSKVPIIRNTMAEHPHAEWFFYLDPTAIIMNPLKSLEEMLIHPVNQIKLKDVSIVPPNGLIRTLKDESSQIYLIISSNEQGIYPGELLLRQGEYAKALLDTWNNVLYRQYNWERAEQSALEHLFQWHQVFLKRLAIVPTRTMSSFPQAANAELEGYSDGDFIVNIDGCKSIERSCEKEFNKYYISRWRIPDTQET
ncbi:putative alpha-1,2-galactosyltransferase [Neolecta irregularis DAH-3]|uniref:Putative alpha-1,2-galactosyltransferase n=1 Tax=Neolecta irregularis (strain DAH-3) TaxID=1198029 RepID=A0A1U7LU37_NEOID|nr:putative alpha-1,2-galactosyltransferase [Neolecta irregularis DAH-3]|eukprot:OLL26031.1 putative alpha-1,2-galactosyltransferase [Neolecta irregularis DAH-3]